MSKLLHLITVIIIALLFAGCGDKYVSKEWNQKMTVTVEIDGETYTGSAIQRLQMNYDAERGTYDGYSGTLLTTTKWSNEAVIIDLGKHGYLFALWGYDYPNRYANAYPTEYPNGPPKLSDKEEKNVRTRAQAYRKYLEALARPENQASPTLYPEFVTFEDMSKPKTIKSFRAKGDGYAPSYHNALSFKKYYGGAARVVSVVVENTEEPLELGRIDQLFKPNFFTDWKNQAHGERKNPNSGVLKARGPCWGLQSEYNKQNKLYCRSSKADFVFDRIGIGAED